MKSNRRVFSIVLACVLALMSLVVTSAGAEDAIGGVVGNMRWNFKPTEGALHIECMGDLPVTQPAPWQQYADMITTVVFYEQVTSIPAGFLDGCNNVTVVKIPASVRTIGASALSSLPRLSYIVYEGSLAALQSVQMSADDLAKVQQSAFQQATIEIRNSEQVYVPVVAPAAQETSNDTTEKKSSKHHHHHKHHKKRPVRRARRVVTAKNVETYVNNKGEAHYLFLDGGKTTAVSDKTTGDVTEVTVYKAVPNSDGVSTVVVTKKNGQVVSEEFNYSDSSKLTKKYSYDEKGTTQTSVTTTYRAVGSTEDVTIYTITFDKDGKPSNVNGKFSTGDEVVKELLENTVYGQAMLTVEEASQIEGVSDMMTEENLQGEIEVLVDENGEEVAEAEAEVETEDETAETITQESASEEAPVTQSHSEESSAVETAEDYEDVTEAPAVEQAAEASEEAPAVKQAEPSEPAISQAPVEQEFYESYESHESYDEAPAIYQSSEASESYSEPSYESDPVESYSDNGGSYDYDEYLRRKKKKNLYYDFGYDYFG